MLSNITRRDLTNYNDIIKGARKVRQHAGPIYRLSPRNDFSGKNGLHKSCRRKSSQHRDVTCDFTFSGIF